MKKIIFCILFAGLIWFFFVQQRHENNTLIPSKKTQTLPSKPTLRKPVSNSLFFPYWTLSENEETASSPQISNNKLPITKYIYFGVMPDIQGINQSEPGFNNIESFVKQVGNADLRSLTLRMINDDVSSVILKDTELTRVVLSQTIDIAKRNGFSEIVLDLEVKSLPFEGAREEITNFYTHASHQIKEVGLEFSTTLYGDTFYRKRPYDVKKIAELVDHVYIMAYDFHKSYGTPGPNFPLSGYEQYGYDMKQMIADFSSQANPEKITVVFGLFGYDWTVDEKNRPLKAAHALTLNQIKPKFISSCAFDNCVIKKDTVSSETSVTYQDGDNRTHRVWFEDETSVSQKIEILKSVGITSFSFWAKGYY